MLAACIVTALLLAVPLASQVHAPAPGQSPAPRSAGPTPEDQVKTVLSGLFTENCGQLKNSDIMFYTPSGSAAFMNDSMFVYSLNCQSKSPDSGMKSAVRFTFIGAKSVRPKGLEPLPWGTNYLRGNNTQEWRTGVQSFRSLVYENLWDGIDLIYTMDNSSLKYSYIVHPFADISQISVKLEGHEALSVAEDGSLSIGTGLGPGTELMDSGLDVFYSPGGQRLEAAFNVDDIDSYSFSIRDRDPSRTLIIDPFVYSTFLGGSGSEQATGVALDSEGNVYVTGCTDSEEFSTIPGTFETPGRARHDIVVSKISYSGRTLLYTSFIGGGDYDGSHAIAADPAGCAYVTGVTFSSDFPTTLGSFDRTYNGTGDAFALKLSQNGQSLVYSGFLGGTHDESGNGITVDAEGRAYVAGETWSADFPTTSGAYGTLPNGDSDAFISKISAYGDVLVYSSFLGGSGSDFGTCIAVRDGSAFVGGMTRSVNFPVTDGQLNRTGMAGDNVFVTKLVPRGDSIDYSACLGGSDDDLIRAIALDSAGCAYITGETVSDNYQTTAGAYDRTFNGLTDSFVTKLNVSGASIDYSTYIGSNGTDISYGISLDPAGRAHITGSTDSGLFPTSVTAYERSFNGLGDSFILKLAPSGGYLEYSSYLGGSDQDCGRAIAVENNGNLCIAGETASKDFPVTFNAVSKEHGGKTDIFVSKMDIIIPVASAGPDQRVNESNAVRFNGTASHDNAAIANYSWTFFDGLQNLTLYDPSPLHIFRVPGTYTVTLTVKDGVGNTDTDTLSLRILVYPIPVAEAGPDLSVEQGSTLVFDGSESRDNVLVTSYLWTFGDGKNNVSLVGVTPAWTFNEPGFYRITLTVRDIDGNSDSDIFNVTVSDLTRPTADPGPGQVLVWGTNATFVGSDSTDRVGLVNYSWTFIYNGTQIVLNGPNQTFRFWTPGVYNVTLTVLDAAGNSDNNSVAVTVILPEPGPEFSAVNPAGIILLSLSIIFLLGLSISGRKKGKGPLKGAEP